MKIQCAICMSNVDSSDSIEATICGHVFHNHCLNQWLSTSPTCPQCRTKKPKIVRLYFSAPVNDSVIDASALEKDIENAQLEVINLRKDISKKEIEIKTLKQAQKKYKDIVTGLESVRLLDKVKLDKLQNDLNFHTKELKRLSDVEVNLKKANDELEGNNLMKEILECHSNQAYIKEQLAKMTREQLYAAVCRSTKEMTNLLANKEAKQKALIDERRKNLDLSKIIRKLKDKISTLESDNYKLLDDMLKLKCSTDEASTKESIPEIATSVSSTSMQSPILPLPVGASNSPYLNIKSSTIGLSPLLSIKRKSVNDNNKVPEATANDAFRNLSIFNNPRKMPKTSTTLRNPSLVYNGTGGTERKENFIGFPQAMSTVPNGTRKVLTRNPKS